MYRRPIVGGCSHDLQCTSGISVRPEKLYYVHQACGFYLYRPWSGSPLLRGRLSTISGVQANNKVSAEEALRRVERCLSDIVSWMHTNMLKLNTDKTEVIVFSSKHNEQFVGDITITISASLIKPAKVVRNLRAFFDSRMNMESHVNSVCRSSYAKLRQISHIRQYITSDATKSLVNSLVTSRLDYCNSLLYGLPKTSLNKLQTVQNTAARIISKASCSCHITSILKELHWLPIDSRIKYKICTLTYKALHNQAPAYIKSLLELYTPKRTLRSQDNTLILVQLTSKTVSYGDHCFCVCVRLGCGIPYQ